MSGEQRDRSQEQHQRQYRRGSAQAPHLGGPVPGGPAGRASSSALLVSQQACSAAPPSLATQATASPPRQQSGIVTRRPHRSSTAPFTEGLLGQRALAKA